MRKTKPATVAAQAGGAVDPSSGGVVPSIQPSTTFVRDRDYELQNGSYSYARYHNDTTAIAEGVLAELEGAAAALVFPSGMAAIAAVFRTIPTGGAAIIQSGIYHGTSTWVRDFCARRDVSLHEVDASDAAALDRLCRAHRADIVLVETPSNPWLKVVDIRSASRAAKQAGAILLVDSTAATPILSQPLALGADIVMHSSTKAINGHSDVLSGVLATAAVNPMWQAIEAERNGAGTVIGPFEAWLLVRGMRTLPLRVERMCQNAMQIAEFLHEHPGVEDVFYPGLPGFAGHDLAALQMQGGFGYLMSFLVKGDAADALRVAGRLNLFHRATSLGGVESLIEHRHTIEPDSGIPVNLLRISVGIEDAQDLIDDLGQALGQ
ncbi:MAG: PLP-dependent transferase [Paracoccaceae bacterium]